MNNFISKHHSYYDDTSLILHQIVDRYRSVYSLSGERFENRIKLDWPNPFQHDDPSFYILDSGTITGTLCLYKHRNGDERVVLWNPATQEFKVIPPSPLVESVPPYQDPYIVLHGFGYDHVTDDYKLIRHVSFFIRTDLDDIGLVPWENRDYNPLWEIYSLRSNSWRKLDNVSVPLCRDSVAGEQLYMDGICHWWGVGESETHNDEAAYFVSSFDLSNEVFFTTPIPLDILSHMDNSFDFYSMLIHLVVLNASIALVSWYFGTTTFHISILAEPGVKESWTKLFIVGPLPCIEYPIGAGKKGDIFFRKKDGELVWFDLSTRMIEELGVKGDYSSHIGIYKESLLPIGGIKH